MKEIRFLMTADWHADSDNKKSEKLKDSLDQMLAYVQGNKVNAIIHSGDVWEKRQTYDDKSGVPLVVKYLKAMASHVDFIFITKGNNSHDEPGSIKLLHQLEPNILAFEYPVVLVVNDDGGWKDILRTEFVDHPDDMAHDYIVSLVPYPTKAMFIQDQSIDLNNDSFLEMFEQVFELIGDVTQPYTCPKILGFHGNVVGSRLSTGQTLVSQDIMVAPSTLEKANHDYYALGHIHLRQEIKPNMVYSGSIYNKSWGETEQKSFEVIEYSFNEIENLWESYKRQIMLTSARPMIKLSGKFSDGKINIEGDETVANGEYRLRIDVKENDRKLITDSQIEELKDEFGNDVKIGWNIIPDERTARSENIMACRSLLDEVMEYSKVIEFDITDGIKEKINSLIEEKQEVYNETN